jgi:hypothetical protein
MKKVDPQLEHEEVAWRQEATFDDKGDFDNLHYCCSEYRDCVNESVHEGAERLAQLAQVLKVGQYMHPNKDQQE